MIEYPYTVFMGFQKAIKRHQVMQAKLLLNTVRVGASDDNKRCTSLWKDLSK